MNQQQVADAPEQEDDEGDNVQTRQRLGQSRAKRRQHANQVKLRPITYYRSADDPS